MIKNQKKNIKSLYQELVEDWLRKIEVSNADNRLCFQQFQKVLNEKLRNKILKDNMIADTILFLLQNHKRFWLTIQHLKGISHRKSPRDCLFIISQTLYDQKFIGKSQCMNIKSALKEKTQIEERILQIINGKADTWKQQQKLWDRLMRENLQTFWQDIIQNSFLFQEILVRNLFFKIKQVIKRKISSQKYQLILEMMGFSPLDEQLQRIASAFDFFNSPFVNSVQKQVEEIKITIKKLMGKSKNGYERKVEVNPYGSFSSQFSLIGSDVDLAFFYSSSFFDKKQIQKILWQLVNKLRETQRLKIKQIKPIINDIIKVPVITIEFEKTMPLKSVDIVFNNSPGVRNSLFLKQYSKQPIIKNIGLLIKRWAKVHSLITKQKMSSYGIILMLLFFLMSRQYLPFPTVSEISQLCPNTNLKAQSSYSSLLIQFCQFYQENGEFFQTQREKQFICLVKQCDFDHNEIYKEDFVYNMHDPFDNSNPGRLKQRDRYYCFSLLKVFEQQLARNSKEKKKEFIGVGALFEEQGEEIASS